jgi:hypothetical protein
MPAATPPAAAHAPTELVAALAAVLRPLARLCIERGLPFAAVAEQLKAAFVEAALGRTPDAARRVSQVSAATGINRREVTRLLSTEPPKPSMRDPTRSIVTEVFTRWATAKEYRDRRGGPRALDRQGAGKTFEALARSVTNDIHPRSILEQLLRLGLASFDAQTDRVTLVRDAFVPRGDSLRMVAFLGENVGDHLAGAVDNVLGDGQRHFEQAVFADELSEASMQQVHALITTQWKMMTQTLVSDLERLIEEDRSHGRAADKRLRIGLYSYEARMPEMPQHVPARKRRTRKEPYK